MTGAMVQPNTFNRLFLEAFIVGNKVQDKCKSMMNAGLGIPTTTSYSYETTTPFKTLAWPSNNSQPPPSQAGGVWK